MRRSFTVWRLVSLLVLLALRASPALAQAPRTQQPPPPPQRASTGPHEGFGVQIAGGPVFANLSDLTNSSSKNDVDIPGDTSGFEVGWVAGAGVEVLRFSIQARYLRGLKQISKNFDVANAQDVKTQAVLILAAFRLN